MLVYLWRQDSSNNIGKPVGQTIPDSQDPGRIHVYLDSRKYFPSLPQKAALTE